MVAGVVAAGVVAAGVVTAGVVAAGVVAAGVVTAGTVAESCIHNTPFAPNISLYGLTVVGSGVGVFHILLLLLL